MLPETSVSKQSIAAIAALLNKEISKSVASLDQDETDLKA